MSAGTADPRLWLPVPFGKYKDQPLVAMQEDGRYCECFLNCTWAGLHDRYPVIHRMVSQFWKPPASPEVIRMLARFRERGLCEYLAGLCGVTGNVGDMEFEVCGFDTIFAVAGTRFCVQCRLSLGNDYPSVLRRVKAALRWARRDLRNDGKACVPILLVGRFDGLGITLPEVGQIFWCSRIRVIQLECELLDESLGAIGDDRVVEFPGSWSR
jgi:hypothetical protein